MEELESGEEDSEASADWTSSTRLDSFSCSFSSSAATRCAMWRSRVFARVEFVCGGERLGGVRRRVRDGLGGQRGKGNVEVTYL